MKAIKYGWSLVPDSYKRTILTESGLSFPYKHLGYGLALSSAYGVVSQFSPTLIYTASGYLFTFLSSAVTAVGGPSVALALITAASLCSTAVYLYTHWDQEKFERMDYMKMAGYAVATSITVLSLGAIGMSALSYFTGQAKSAEELLGAGKSADESKNDEKIAALEAKIEKIEANKAPEQASESSMGEKALFALGAGVASTVGLPVLGIVAAGGVAYMYKDTIIENGTQAAQAINDTLAGMEQNVSDVVTQGANKVNDALNQAQEKANEAAEIATQTKDMIENMVQEGAMQLSEEAVQMVAGAVQIAEEAADAIDMGLDALGEYAEGTLAGVEGAIYDTVEGMKQDANEITSYVIQDVTDTLNQSKENVTQAKNMLQDIAQEGANQLSEEVVQMATGATELLEDSVNMISDTISAFGGLVNNIVYQEEPDLGGPIWASEEDTLDVVADAAANAIGYGLTSLYSFMDTSIFGEYPEEKAPSSEIDGARKAASGYVEQHTSKQKPEEPSVFDISSWF